MVAIALGSCKQQKINFGAKRVRDGVMKKVTIDTIVKRWGYFWRGAVITACPLAAAWGLATVVIGGC